MFTRHQTPLDQRPQVQRYIEIELCDRAPMVFEARTADPSIAFIQALSHCIARKLQPLSMTDVTVE